MRPHILPTKSKNTYSIPIIVKLLSRLWFWGKVKEKKICRQKLCCKCQWAKLDPYSYKILYNKLLTITLGYNVGNNLIILIIV